MNLKDCKAKLKALNTGKSVKIRLRKRSGGYSIFLVYEKVTNEVRHKDKRTTGIILTFVKREEQNNLDKLEKAIKMRDRFEQSISE